MNKNFTIKTGQTQAWTLTFRRMFTLITLFFLTQTLVQANAFLDVTVTSTDASCGGNDGTATAQPTNGWAPFTYQWSNGGTTQSISGLAPGTYSVTVIDVDGAIAIGSTVVGQSGGLNLFMSASYETCPGSADGTASVNVSGGVEPYTYEWSTGSTFVVAYGLSAGTYTVTVTDANGCSSVGTVTVELSPEGIWLMPTATNADCGLANGTAYAGVMTGVAPYTFLWSDGQTTETATGLAAGNYSVTVTDANGCSNSASVTVESNSDLDITVSGTDVQCGLSNGSATVSVNGGTPPFTYMWNTGASTASINNLSAGTYSVTVTDVDGCSNAGTVTINAQDGIQITVSGTDANCNNNDGSASADVTGGTAPYSYSWSNGGNTASITGLAPGTYDVTATDANGCVATVSVTIGGSTVDGGFIITTDNTHLCVGDGSDDFIDVTLSGNIGSNSKWLITSTSLDILGVFDSPPFNFENAPPGVCVIWHISYDGVLTGLEIGLNAGNLSGCFDLSNSIEVLRQNCCDLDGGDITTNSNTTICAGDGVDDFIDVTLSGNSAGVNQSWIITDQAGNILALPAAPPFNLEGAGAGICLIWSISYENGLTGLSVGENVSGLDGCYALSNQSIAVTRNPAPFISLTGVDASCSTASDGSITVDVIGGTAPYSYSWSTGASSSSLDGLTPGTYSVTVTDDNGCSDTGSATIGGPNLNGGDISTNSNTTICVGDGVDDLVDVTLIGGSPTANQAWVITDQAGLILGLPAAPPFNFEGAGEGVCLIWSISYLDGLSGLSQGSFVADLQGCYALSNQSITVTRNLAPTISLSGGDASCEDAGDGTITVNISNGTAPFSYSWSTGATSASLSGLAPGTYSVTVTDANGCSDSGSITLGGPTINGGDISTNDNTTVCVGDGIDDFVNVSLSGASADANQAWIITDQAGNILDLPAAPPFNFEGAGTGVCLIWSISYLDGLNGLTVGANVTDLDGCYALSNQSIAVTRNLAPIISLTGTDASCSDASDGSISTATTGGTTPFSYSWSTGATSADLSGLAPGTYSVTVTDANGCSDSGSTTIGGPTINGGDISTNDNTTVCVGDGADDFVNVTLTGGSPIANQAWVITDQAGNILDLPAAPPFNFEGAGAGVCLIWSISYLDGLNGLTVGANVADLEGCYALSNQSIAVTRNLAPIISLTGTDASCSDASDGSISTAITGGTAPFSYSWSTGATSADLSGLAPGTYSVTVTDANGCSDSGSTTIGGPTINGGDISTNDNTTVCVGDGADDFVNVTLTGGSPIANQAWVITDQAGNILDLPAAPPFNFEGAGAGVCLIWSISYLDGLNGLTVGANVADLEGCYALSNQSIAVTRNLAPIISLTGTDASCSDASDGSISTATTGGTAPFTYSWSTGATSADLSGLAPGTYSVTVTDANGCSDTGSATIEGFIIEGGDLFTNSNTTICAGDGIDDLINVNLSGASAGLNQAWVITDQAGNILALPAGPPFNLEGAGAGVCLIWSISYLDGLSGLTEGANVSALSGCYSLSSQAIEVIRYLAPTISLNGTDVSCNGAADGSITININDGTAPFSYNWSTGATSASLSGLAPGTYAVTVTDANGCSDDAEITISEPTALTLSFDGGEETCIGSADGFASVTASGGTPPYSYLWSNGATTALNSGLSAGTYGVTVTDANGCVSANSSAVTVISNGITSCSAAVTSSYNEGVDISTFGGSDGSAAVNVFGGTAPLSYLWSNGQTGASASGLNAGTYTVDITDANGCTCSADITLVDPSKVGNFVWEDDNRNGIQDAGEPGIGGIGVTLTGTSGTGANVNRATTTDGNGAYSFDGLPAGNYKVTFNGGAILKKSPKGAGSDGSLDSDMNEDGMTDFFDLGPAVCNNDIDAGFYECVIIGDFVFYDGNRDGIQQLWEAGVANVPVLLLTTGPDGIYCNEDDVIVDGATTANNGRYYFECVEPGQYYISFGINTSEYFITSKDVGGDDELDSDADPMTGKTGLFTVTEGQPDDLSYDAGIYLICDDFNSGGQIGYNQDLCFGEPADPIVSVSLPGGGYGDTEYLWLKSTLGGSLGNGSWIEIQNNDSPTYDPGFLNTTTFFIRCARRDNCDNFVAESNIVVITVSSCGNSGFVQDLSADVMAGSRIALHWSTEPENGLYRYHVERSADAVDFDAIGSVEGLGNQQSMNRYEFMDNSPRIGRNLYRVLREDLSSGEIMYSNTVEAMFNPSDKQFFVYPNPTRNELFIESVYNMNGNATLELYSATGQLLELIQVNQQIGSTNIDFTKYASGPYFIKVIMEDKEEFEIIRIIKE